MQRAHMSYLMKLPEDDSISRLLVRFLIFFKLLSVPLADGSVSRFLFLLPFWTKCVLGDSARKQQEKIIKNVQRAHMMKLPEGGSISRLLVRVSIFFGKLLSVSSNNGSVLRILLLLRLSTKWVSGNSARKQQEKVIKNVHAKGSHEPFDEVTRSRFRFAAFGPLINYHHQITFCLTRKCFFNGNKYIFLGPALFASKTIILWTFRFAN